MSAALIRHLPKAAMAVFCVGLAGFTAQAGENDFQLCSPENGDHFEVSQPLLFWQSSVGAKHYEVFIDDAKAGEVTAAPALVMNFTPSIALADGEHRWHVKAVMAYGNDIDTSNFVFTVESSTNWPAWAIGPFVRYGGNPILRPQLPVWEDLNAYNPGVIFDQGRFLMLYRGQERNLKSRIGYAESLDGVTFHPSMVPMIDATEPFETRYGCEDPRLVKYQGVFYVFYTGNRDEKSSEICLCEATSTNGINWTKLGVIERGTKNGAIVRNPVGEPVKINGKFVMYTGDSKFGVCYSDDLMHWSSITWIDLKLPPGWTTPYEPCVAIADYSIGRPDDIVVFIAGTLNGNGKWFYAISEVLFRKSNLTTKADQLNDCIMKPREDYESGTFKDCLWMNSILRHNGQWWMHYGAGDRNIGLATAPLK
jgi:predicted GH43/DUF377 family glycosyl hydrolase